MYKRLLWILQGATIILASPLAGIAFALERDRLSTFLPNICRSMKVILTVGFAHFLAGFNPEICGGYFSYKKKDGSFGPIAFYWKYPGKRYYYDHNVIKEESCDYPFFTNNKKYRLRNQKLFLQDIKVAKDILNYKRNERRTLTKS